MLHCTYINKPIITNQRQIQWFFTCREILPLHLVPSHEVYELLVQQPEGKSISFDQVHFSFLRETKSSTSHVWNVQSMPFNIRNLPWLEIPPVCGCFQYPIYPPLYLGENLFEINMWHCWKQPRERKSDKEPLPPEGYCSLSRGGDSWVTKLTKYTFTS